VYTESGGGIHALRPESSQVVDLSSGITAFVPLKEAPEKQKMFLRTHKLLNNDFISGFLNGKLSFKKYGMKTNLLV